jgi:hypothetical protein
VYCFCRKHCSCVTLLQNKTNPEYIGDTLAVPVNKPARDTPAVGSLGEI